MRGDSTILSEREKLVLYSIVKNFILTATPVASSYISRHSSLSFSPATIRHIMSKLEEKGYIFQPHKSSGRIPTSAGYRIFVDQMIKKGRLSQDEKEKIRQAIKLSTGDYESVFRESSRILAYLSKQLSILISPQLDEGIFHRMEISRLGSERLLLVISIKSGIVKTIVLEIESEIQDKQLEVLKQVLNERLDGLKIREIRLKFREIVQDLADEKSGLMHLFIDTADRIFDFSENNNIFVTGTHNFLRQPEFNNYSELSSVVEVLEDKNIIVHLLDQSGIPANLNVLIGDEIEESKMKNCSIISARYKIGQVQGTLGIVGPTRMDYVHLIPLVEYAAYTLSEIMESEL
ncbi:MAG: heat-inducible transcription repressor HrcA [Calditrichaeota bacterium]|nr:heat-inducible transcription repressor HrcA [Calditrichota bacterium]RQW04668.1 MAG: heat-inducible transcription repressor HrcA [Calditrichota bacterium]